MRATRFPLLTAAVVVTAALGLAACNKTDRPPLPETATAPNPAPTPKSDSPVTLPKADSGMPGPSGGAVPAPGAPTAASGTVVESNSKLKDASITTEINVGLAKDPALSALKINVDTNDGRVLLKGTAPDPAARERATQLAQAVTGVVSVDNQLQVTN